MSTTIERKKYMTINEVCEFLGVRPTFAKKLVSSGMIERVYLPSPSAKKRQGVPRITVESVQRYEKRDVKSPVQDATPPGPRSRRSKASPPRPLSPWPHFS